MLEWKKETWIRVPSLFDHVKSPLKRQQKKLVRYARVKQSKRKRIEAVESKRCEVEQRERCEEERTVVSLTIYM